MNDLKRTLAAIAALLAFSTLCWGQTAQTGTVWFYRVEEAPRFFTHNPKLRIDAKVAANFPEREYMGVRLPVGRHIFVLGQPENAIALIVEAGKDYFVRVSYTRSANNSNNVGENLYVIEPVQAELHFEQMKRALQDKNITDKTLQVISEKPVFPK